MVPWTPWWLAIVALGCGGTYTDTAAPSPAPQISECALTPAALSACVVVEGEPAPAQGSRISRDLWLDVDELGHGEPPHGCPSAALRAYDPRADWARAAWISGRDVQGREVVVGLLGVGTPTLHPGDRIRVGWDRTVDRRGDGALELRASGGALLAWIELARWAGESGLPAELEVETGGRVCDYSHECGTVDVTGLRVTVGGEQVEVPPGERRRAGDYEITTRAAAHDAEHTGVCPGWTVGLADYAVVSARSTPSSP